MRFVVVMWACICGGRSASGPTGRSSATCSWRTTAASTASRAPRCWSTSAARTSSTSTGCAGWRRRSRASPTATAAGRCAGAGGRVRGHRLAAAGRRVAAGRRCGGSSGSIARCAGCSARGGSRTDVERVLFALVANRALDPCSKLAAAEWVSEDAHIRGPGRDGRGPGLPRDGPAGRGRRAGAGAGGGVLRRRRPAQPRGRPAVLRHHRARTSSATSPTRRARTARRRFAPTGTARTTAPTCRRS